MAVSINNGDTTASFDGEIIDIRGVKNVAARAQWGATGSTAGKIGLRLGIARTRLEDVGYLDGPNFDGHSGAQPNGSGAGSIAVQFENGFNWAQLYFVRESGGSASSGMMGDITGPNGT